MVTGSSSSDLAAALTHFVTPEMEARQVESQVRIRERNACLFGTHPTEPDPYDDFCPTCDAPEPTHTPTCAVVHIGVPEPTEQDPS